MSNKILFFAVLIVLVLLGVTSYFLFIQDNIKSEEISQYENIQPEENSGSLVIISDAQNEGQIMVELMNIMEQSFER